MTVFIFLLGLLQCALLWLLGRVGYSLTERANREHQLVAAMPAQEWPSCALIVPVAGANPVMEAALRSLAEQNYPDYNMYLVLAGQDDAAAPLVARLAREYSRIVPVMAGMSQNCGQKNCNQLAGVAAAGDKAEVYAFCDSTHLAQPDFLRCLVAPIAAKQAAFTTGYHEVEPRDQGIVSLAYALCVMFMRFMQALPKLAQPWGGAMAMSRRAYETAEVGKLWQTNVVDDCSLAAMLQKDGISVKLCPGALLRTWAINHPFAIWRAWLERQILFLKFCIPGQWLMLGLVCVLMALPPLWAIWACVRGILGIGGGSAPFLALCWFCILGWMLTGWRRFLPEIPPISRWLVAFFGAVFMFALVYLGTLGSHTLLWHNIIYRVGKGGRVIGMERE